MEEHKIEECGNAQPLEEGLKGAVDENGIELTELYKDEIKKENQ